MIARLRSGRQTDTVVDAVAEGAPDRPDETRTHEIPDKLYFRIGEVGKIAGVKPYVLRFWETEFPLIAPKKSGTGHRLYRRKDVEIILQIRELLHERRFTIEGARKHLEGLQRGRTVVVQPTSGQSELFPPPRPTLEDVRRELLDLVRLLSRSS